MRLMLLVAVFGLFTKTVLSANLVCGATSGSKTITIQSPASIPAQCTYTIKPSSTKICQLRVVLEEFILAPPAPFGNGHPICNHDIFAVAGLRLCGVNNKQHFYVTSTHAKPVSFSLLLASRIQFPTLENPKWKITITQLECPAGILGRNLISHDAIETVDAEQSNNLTVQQRAAIPDGFYLAPIGCLQYFPDSTGIVESFNLNTNIGPYYSDFSYAICFGRGENDTSVRLSPVFFQMGIGVTDGDGLDSDCCAKEPIDGQQEDYIFLPFATLETGARATRFCGTSLAKEYVDIKPPGPFVINVVSDINYNAATDIGFKFNYQIS